MSVLSFCLASGPRRRRNCLVKSWDIKEIPTKQWWIRQIRNVHACLLRDRWGVIGWFLLHSHHPFVSRRWCSIGNLLRAWEYSKIYSGGFQTLASNSPTSSSPCKMKPFFSPVLLRTNLNCSGLGMLVHLRRTQLHSLVWSWLFRVVYVL